MQGSQLPVAYDVKNKVLIIGTLPTHSFFTDERAKPFLGVHTLPRVFAEVPSIPEVMPIKAISICCWDELSGQLPAVRGKSKRPPVRLSQVLDLSLVGAYVLHGEGEFLEEAKALVRRVKEWVGDRAVTPQEYL